MLNLKYCCWTRADCYGMFDHTDLKNIQSFPSIVIKEPGILFRNKLNYDLEFIPARIKETTKVMQKQYQQILVLDVKQQIFFVGDGNADKNEPLCLMISGDEGCRLKENDAVKVGKVRIDVLKISWKRINKNNHYEDAIKPSIPNKRSVFTPSFYSNRQSASMVETNPACRYCYSKTISDHNAFMAICHCIGSSKYIHQDCLLEWINKRNQSIVKVIADGFYCVLAKSLTCELCNCFYEVDRLIKRVFDAGEEELNQYMVLHLNIENGLIYVIDLQKVQTFTIGRNLDCQIIVHQLSVSRKHSHVQIDTLKQTITIFDQAAKFGTTLLQHNAQITHHPKIYQKGRTKITLSFEKKKTFFQKIGFCSPEENLKDQHSN